ncbi:Ferrous iron permease EfeU [compost metagenome]
MEQALLIVWRESVEAMLVIGILHAWLRRHPSPRRSLRLLWTGVLGGGLLAALLATLMVLAGEWMSGPSGEWFQAAMGLVASALVLQMLAWMTHGRQLLRHRLEDQASLALAHGRESGLVVLAALAVAREGSEVAIFLYGAGGASSAGQILLGALLGLALGGLSFTLLQVGGRALDWRRFFAVSQWLLVLLGGAMLMGALDRASGQLMAMDLPEVLYAWLGDPLWDSSAWLDDGSRLGALIASLTGYRAMPSAAAVLLLSAFWLLAWRLLRAPRVSRELTASPS